MLVKIFFSSYFLFCLFVYTIMENVLKIIINIITLNNENKWFTIV